MTYAIIGVESGARSLHDTSVSFLPYSTRNQHNTKNFENWKTARSYVGIRKWCTAKSNRVERYNYRIDFYIQYNYGTSQIRTGGLLFGRLSLFENPEQLFIPIIARISIHKNRTPIFGKTFMFCYLTLLEITAEFAKK